MNVLLRSIANAFLCSHERYVAMREPGRAIAPKYYLSPPFPQHSLIWYASDK